MITIFTPDCNTISQKIYDDVVDSLDIRLLQCPSCGHHGFLVYHGSYRRTIRTAGASLRLSVIRVKCSNCGHTHAILLSSIVPYSQIPVETQRRIALRADGGRSFAGHGFDGILDATLDEGGIRSVIRSYRKHWRQRLLAAGIRLADLPLALRQCFAVYGRQFMQIKRTVNTLFVVPT